MKRSPIHFVIPAAGLGSRFNVPGFSKPKPAIDILGVPMLCWVIGNFKYIQGDKITVITRRESNIESDCQPFLDNFDVPVEFFVIDHLTEGPAATVETLKEFIDLESPLIVVNSDQYIMCDSDTFLDVFRKNEHFGFILTMTANDSKWSFIERDSNREIRRVVEKQIVSDEATVGLYGWSHAKHFFYSLDKMVEQGDRHNGEYYVAPTFNFLLKVGIPIFTFGIGAVEDAVFGLGTPADLEIFLRHKSVREFRSQVTKSLRIS